jgi:phosphatidylglycerophosphate synthase
MISKATDHKATVLMNRRMNTERRVTTFGPVCSNVAGMALHHLEGRRTVQEGSASDLATSTRRSLELLSGHRSSTLLWIPSAMNESAVKAIDRRPIATRNRKWAQSATAWLAARNVSPNSISIAGMCACVAAGVALGLTSVEYNRILWLVAALGAQLRLTANMLDGMVALASGRASKVGELYNEVPDRVSDAVVFVGAGYAWGGNVALGYLATILAIFTAYVRAAGKIAGAPNEFCGPMAKQHRMLVITVACVYSVLFPRSWQIFHLDDFDVGVMSLALTLIIAGCVVTVLRRFKRIARALR